VVFVDGQELAPDELAHGAEEDLEDKEGYVHRTEAKVVVGEVFVGYGSSVGKGIFHLRYGWALAVALVVAAVFVCACALGLAVANDQEEPLRDIGGKVNVACGWRGAARSKGW